MYKSNKLKREKTLQEKRKKYKITIENKIMEGEQKIMIKQNKGITLIILVITIVLLIIFAGIIINIGLKENGLFARAKEARDKYLIAEKEEQNALNQLYKQLGIEGQTEQVNNIIPENTQKIEAGTIVKTPEKWKTVMPNYVSDITIPLFKVPPT